VNDEALEPEELEEQDAELIPDREAIDPERPYGAADHRAAPARGIVPRRTVPSRTMVGMRSAFATVLATACLTAPAGAATGQGLYGLVTRGPTRPVCSSEAPCSEPAAHTELRFLRRTVLVATVATDARGHYRLRLPRGLYTVRVAGAPPGELGGRIDPASVRVRDAWRRQNFDIDTGIR